MLNNCTHAAFDTDTGNVTCLLWDDEPYQCIGWLRPDRCCINYETFDCYYLVKEK